MQVAALKKKPGSAETDLGDGRRLRTQNSRRKISEGFIALVAEGVVTPTAEEVALRAGVGVRSVFRHFKDMETLYLELVAHSEQLTARLSTPVAEAADLQATLDQLVDERIHVYDNVMPFQIAAQAHQHESANLSLHGENFAAQQRATLLDALPRHLLKDKAVVEALNLALSFDTWRRLRREQRLSRPAARRVVVLTCSALLQDAAATGGTAPQRNRPRP
jgi:AcrR family transcriptional regulator